MARDLESRRATDEGPVVAVAPRTAGPTVRTRGVRRLLSSGGVQAILVFFTFVTLGPLVLIWMTSLKSTIEMSIDPLGLPQQWLFSNFVDAWNTADLGQYALNSVLVAVPTLVLVLVSASLAGYALASLTFPGRDLFFGVFLLGLMVPSISVAVALYYTERSMGLLDTLPGLILAEAAQAMPLSIFVMRSGFRDLPRELREAVLVDGGNDFDALVRVLLPLARPALTAAAVVSFLLVWNDYLLPLVLINTATQRTLPLGVSLLYGQYTTDIVLVAAATSLSTLPSILIYVILQRQFVQGVVQGSLK